MNQSDVDIFAIRGFLGIVKLLEERLSTNPDGFSLSVQQELKETEIRFRKIVAEILSRPTTASFEDASIERLDRWFAGGFSNLLNFLEDRLNHGPPISCLNHDKISLALDRACLMGLTNVQRNLAEKS